MRPFIQGFGPTWRRRLGAVAAACAAAAVIAIGTLPTASAAPPAKAAVVPPPSVIEVVEAESNRVAVTVDAGSGFTVQGELVSGPQLPGGPAVRVQSVDPGWQRISNLVPDSDYVVRFRRTGFFDRTTNRFVQVTSDWTAFSFRSLAVEQSRPSAPAISEGRVLIDARGVVSLEVLWASSIDNASTATQLSYVYTVNDGPLTPNCFAYCLGTTGARVNPLPAVGSRIRVFAIDRAGNRSLPSNELIVTRTAADAVRP